MGDELSDNQFWVNRIVDTGAAAPQELAKGYNSANWRFHPQIQRDALEEALDSIGVLQPVLFNRLSGKVIDGHLRIELAILKGQPLIPVNYVELTDDEEALALATLDAITEQAQPIPDKLAALMERTKHLTADRPGLREMLEALKERAGINGNGHDNSGQEPETPTETEAEKLAKGYGVKVGQIWALGRHVVACIDSTDESAVKELIGENRVGMVWADPPYGMELDTDYTAMNGSANNVEFRQRKKVVGGKKYPSIIGDSESFDPSPFLRLFTETSEQFWWGADYYAERIDGRNGGSWLVWDKRDDSEQFDKMFGSAFELCWSKSPHKRELLRVRWCGVFGTEKEPDKRRFHPTQKPVGLVEEIYQRYGHPEDYIFDPFLGSGCSVLAAERLNDGRRVIGCELAPEYIGVTIHRWVQISGQSPRLING